MFLKSVQKLLSLALSAALVLSLSACTIHIEKKDKDTASYASSDDDYGISSDDNSVSSEEDVSSATADTQEFGNDQVGWLTLDSDFYKWYTPGNTETCVQYAKSPFEILSLDVMDSVALSKEYNVEYDAKMAASSRMYYLEESAKTQNITGITGATEKLGQYDAYQVYCQYPDDNQYLVMWFMDSPDKTKVYYVAAEFRTTEMGFFDYAQTYRMPE